MDESAAFATHYNSYGFDLDMMKVSSRCITRVLPKS